MSWFPHICNILKDIWAASWQNQQSDCAPSEDSDQPEHLPSLVRVFSVCMKKAWVLSYPLCAQRRLWSDWVDAHADLSLHWAHSHFVGFVMRWLIYKTPIEKHKICLKSKSFEFVQKIFFQIKLLHANVQCVCIMYAKYQIVSSKSVVPVDFPVYAVCKDKSNPY